MDAPIPPRAADFGLTEAELPRLERYGFPPVMEFASRASDATAVVRWLSPGRLMILGIAISALRFFLWAFKGGDSLGAALTITVLGVLFMGSWMGAIGGLLVSGLVVRPLYLLIASRVVPGFAAFRRLKDAQGKYEAARASFQAWQQRCAEEYWRSLTGVEFERQVARLYQSAGYRVTLTPGTADGGIDIVLEREGAAIAVQCKAHRRKIGVAVARELVSAARDLGAERMMIACTQGVSSPLAAYAREKGIEIITAEGLARLQMSLTHVAPQTLRKERPASIAQRLSRRATRGRS